MEAGSIGEAAFGACWYPVVVEAVQADGRLAVEFLGYKQKEVLDQSGVRKLKLKASLGTADVVPGFKCEFIMLEMAAGT